MYRYCTFSKLERREKDFTGIHGTCLIFMYNKHNVVFVNVKRVHHGHNSSEFVCQNKHFNYFAYLILWMIDSLQRLYWLLGYNCQA